MATENASPLRDDDPAVFDPDNPAVAPRLARWRALTGLRGA